MAEEKVFVDVTSVVLKGGHDKPPKKKKEDEDDKKKTKIPQSENDVDGLTYIED